MNFNFIHIIKFSLVLGLALAARIALPQSSVQSHIMPITYQKTSSVIFPAIIKSVDRGSRDVIAQKAGEVGNVLQLKAGRENFPETNLTVITADGMLHQFTISYVRDPEQLTLELGPAGAGNNAGAGVPVIFHAAMTESQMEQCARSIVDAGKVLVLKREKESRIGLFLKGIYIHENVMFFHVTMNNTSNINYDVEFLRFYIRDQEKVRRTASQEVSIRPLYTFGNDAMIAGNSAQEVVYAFDKFTIPDAKNLVLEMFEQNGGRHLSLAVKNKTIVNAQPIP